MPFLSAPMVDKALFAQFCNIAPHNTLVDTQLLDQLCHRYESIAEPQLQNTPRTFSKIYTDIRLRRSLLCHRCTILLGRLCEVNDMLYEHKIPENVFVLPLPGSDERFDVINLTSLRIFVGGMLASN